MMRIVPPHRTHTRGSAFLPTLLVSAINAHLMMNAQAGVPPAQQLLDQGRIDLSLPSKHREDLVPKEQLKSLQIDVRHHIQPAVGRKQAIRDDGMEMGIR